MAELIWTSVNEHKIYFDGQKIYFVSDPEGFALWIFAALLTFPFGISLFDTLIKASNSLSYWPWLPTGLSFLTVVFGLAVIYYNFFLKPKSVPGPLRNHQFVYDISTKTLSNIKGNKATTLATWPSIFLDFPEHTQTLNLNNTLTYVVYLNYNGRRLPIATGFSSIELNKLMDQLATLGIPKIADTQA